MSFSFVAFILSLESFLFLLQLCCFIFWSEAFTLFSPPHQIFPFSTDWGRILGCPVLVLASGTQLSAPFHSSVSGEACYRRTLSTTRIYDQNYFFIYMLSGRRWERDFSAYCSVHICIWLAAMLPNMLLTFFSGSNRSISL